MQPERQNLSPRLKKLHLELLRYAAFSDRIIGAVRLDGGQTYYTVERPWLDNAPYVSCIPEGVYTLKRHDSPKFKTMQDRHDGEHTWEITGVPNRSVILFHTANYATELHGCVGLGHGSMANLAGIAESRTAVAEFYSATRGITEGTIEVKSGALPADWSLD